MSNSKKKNVRKVSFLTTADFARLNYACYAITEALCHTPYLVGSSVSKDEWRDVDVRSIIPDDLFDRLFPIEGVWSLFCLGVTTHLERMTGLPVDYQVQRMSEANSKYPGPRNPIGTRGRGFAGGGDATPYREKTTIRGDVKLIGTPLTSIPTSKGKRSLYQNALDAYQEEELQPLGRAATIRPESDYEQNLDDAERFFPDEAPRPRRGRYR